MGHFFQDSRFLPEHAAAMAVDAKSFTLVPSSVQPELSARIPALLEAAFRLAGLEEIWEAIVLHQDTGDGHVIVLSPRYLPHLVSPLIDTLQAVLEEEDERLRAQDRDLRLRLRLSLHAGPLPISGEGLREDGKGTTMNDTHRLLDARPVRDALTRSDPNVTFLAALLSDQVFRDVVSTRYTALPASRFQQVEATVEGKVFSERAWLYVPKPSWKAATSDRETDTPAQAAPPRPSGGGTAIRGNSGNIAIGNAAGGNIEQWIS
jgi:hypothetical protein